MKKSSGGKRASRRRNKSAGTTLGHDDMASNTSRKDYFVSNALEITPHANKPLRSALRQPIMDRRFKYSVLESSLAGSSATSATPLNLVSINQGTTDVTRTGDRIRAKRVWLSGKVIGSAAATGPIVSRLLVVVWNPPGVGSVNAPTAGMVIQHSAAYGPYGAYSRDFGDSYQVLYDAVFSVQPSSTTSEADIFHLDRAVTIDMEFTAGATTPTTNTLYLFLVTDAVANQPTVLFQTTVWYEDLDA